MGFFDTLTKAAGEAIQTAKEMTLPIKLTDEALNLAAKALLDEDGEIRSINITMHDGWCQVKALIRKGMSNFETNSSFEIVRFELKKDSQIIELRQKGRLETVAEGVLGKISLLLVDIFISAFLGKNILQWKLQNMKGVTVSSDTISIDLEEIGAKNALFAAVAEKVGNERPYLLPLLHGSAGKLADYVGIESAECRQGILVLNVQYVG